MARSLYRQRHVRVAREALIRIPKREGQVVPHAGLCRSGDRRAAAANMIGAQRVERSDGAHIGHQQAKQALGLEVGVRNLCAERNAGEGRQGALLQVLIGDHALLGDRHVADQVRGPSAARCLGASPCVKISPAAVLATVRQRPDRRVRREHEQAHVGEATALGDGEMSAKLRRVDLRLDQKRPAGGGVDPCIG